MIFKKVFFGDSINALEENYIPIRLVLFVLFYFCFVLKGEILFEIENACLFNVILIWNIISFIFYMLKDPKNS